MRTILLTMLLVIAELLLLSQNSSATDVITQFESLPDGRTLVSEDGSFELGFFSPGSSTNRYVGIWFKNIPVRTVVWVANRDNPIKDNSSVLIISQEGNLVLISQNNTIHWSTNATTKGFSAIAKLLSSGNLVLTDEKDNNPQNYLWQSFDYPTDTLLPGMKLGGNLKTGLNRRLTSWDNWDDPSSGNFTYGLIGSNNPELEMWNGSSKFYRSGPWNGIRFSAIPSLKHRPLFSIGFVSNKDEYYFTYNPRNNSLISRIVINQTIHALQRYMWVEGNQTWKLYLTVPRDGCDNYKRCGSFGNCAMMGESPTCQCLDGFMPKSPQNWTAKDWSQGCVRSETWSCREKNKDGFIKFQNLKFPDTKKSWLNRSMTLEECKAKCWENCSCTAFANSDITGEGSGCIIWFGNVLDLRQLPDTGQDLYIRLAVPASEIANIDTKYDSKKKVVVVTTSTASSIIVMLLIFTVVYWRTKRKNKEITLNKEKNDESEEEDLELPLFDLATIAHATNDFSSDKKLGEGGFGPVYRGTLPNGQDVAVKRLSQNSAQGSKEFKNEVMFCAKLQHRNLVRVIGCCIQEEEKLLIYEYMPNKSLYSFLFDFGLARMCGGDQIEGNTSRVVGTYGYMAPEYAIYGLFSIKSDVFSFGILLLEIVSGKKNTGFSYPSNNCNLIGHAWRLWKEGIPIDLIDTCLEDSCIQSEVLRCVHIGLLCLQHHADDRPDMASVVVMLSSNNILPEPKEPGFLIEKVSIEGKSFSGKKNSSSNNEVTISLLDGR